MSTTDYRRLMLGDIPLLDVRAPVEFQGGAFPASTNLPLLNDDERHRIGICYKQQGQAAAIELGQQLVSGDIRAARMTGWQQWYQQHPDGYLYCFRGGLRSQTVQQWLNEVGVNIPLVSGGYKALRRFLLAESDALTHRLPLVILCGRTGCGKTRVIDAIADSIDLEGLAHHRGSAFGRRPGGQPSQIDFENRLAVALLKLSLQEPHRIIVEDESRLIGRCYVPQAMQERILRDDRIIIQESLDSRVTVTLEDYVVGPLAEYQQYFGERDALGKLGEELLAALDRIQRRLGGSRHRELRETLSAALAEQQRNGCIAGHRRWIEPMLRDYYDPMYDYMLRQRQGTVLFEGSRDDVIAWLKSR